MRTMMLRLLTAASLLCGIPGQASQPLEESSVPKLYPIPARNTLNVVARGDVHGYSIRIVQLNGRLLREMHFPPSDGQYRTLTVSTAGLRSGFYALVYASDFRGGAVAVRRFLVLR
jgi:hypothetical protein